MKENQKEPKYYCVKLKELRLEKGLTQEKLAKLSLISIYKLRRLENLTSYASLAELAAICYHLDVTITYMQGKSSIKRFPDNLKYDEFDDYIKKHEKIKNT